VRSKRRGLNFRQHSEEPSGSGDLAWVEVCEQDLLPVRDHGAGDAAVGGVPAVYAVAGGTVPIGLPPECVREVTEAWAHVGVEASWIDKETPVHHVDLADYWIATYPVTNGEYRDFLPDHLVPGIGAVLAELHQRMFSFQLAVVTVIAGNLGVPAGYFAEMLEDARLSTGRPGIPRWRRPPPTSTSGP
jgi:hypothetical protein